MRGRYPCIVILVDALETVGFTGGAGCFRVAVEEEVEGGEAETLLTTEDITERSTIFWLVCSTAQEYWGGTHSFLTSRLDLDWFLSWYRNRRSGGTVCYEIAERIASSKAGCD